MDKFQPRFVCEFAAYLMKYESPKNRKEYVSRIEMLCHSYRRGFISAMETMRGLMDIYEKERF